MEITKKAFGYLRVSGKDQIDGDGFPRQREAISRWAAAHGVKIVRWFEERGVNGSLAERPALSEMMVALMSNGVKLVVVEKLDRISRDQMLQETIIQSLLKQGLELASAMLGEQDLCSNDPGRKLMRTIMGAIAEYDKALIVLKLKAARQRAKARDGRCEGQKPFGTLEGESDALARLVALRASGANYEAIARQLNAEGIKTRSNRDWFPATVRRIALASSAK